MIPWSLRSFWLWHFVVNTQQINKSRTSRFPAFCSKSCFAWIGSSRELRTIRKGRIAFQSEARLMRYLWDPNKSKLWCSLVCVNSRSTEQIGHYVNPLGPPSEDDPAQWSSNATPDTHRRSLAQPRCHFSWISRNTISVDLTYLNILCII